MLLSVLPLPHPDSKKLIQDARVVVIDVLRASSTILEALMNGAPFVVPVASPEHAFTAKKQYAEKDVLLCGERQGIKVAGFDMGNSPTEFTREKINGRIIIMSSTNGTKAIDFASNAKQVMIGCFRNVAAIVGTLNDDDTNIVLLGSGKLGQFCMEDMVCAGNMIDMFLSKKGLELSDSAMAAHDLYLHYQKNLLGIMQHCEHGRYLASLGFGDDVVFCSRQNVYTRVPILQNGIIK
jgi:2-phosphosulfolactate phosphatase